MTELKLQFYADNRPHYTNKLFSFKVESHDSMYGLLQYFWDNGNSFRAIYLNHYLNGKVVHAIKVDSAEMKELNEVGPFKYWNLDLSLNVR